LGFTRGKMLSETFCEQIWPLSQKCWPSPGLSYYNGGDEFLVDFSKQLALIYLLYIIYYYYLYISTVVDTFRKAGLHLGQLSIAWIIKIWHLII
jgi:hypothetical protein